MPEVTLTEKQCEFLYNLLDNVNLAGRQAIMIVGGILEQITPHLSEEVLNPPAPALDDSEWNLNSSNTEYCLWLMALNW